MLHAAVGLASLVTLCLACANQAPSELDGAVAAGATNVPSADSGLGGAATSRAEASGGAWDAPSSISATSGGRTGPNATHGGTTSAALSDGGGTMAAGGRTARVAASGGKSAGSRSSNARPSGGSSGTVSLGSKPTLIAGAGGKSSVSSSGGSSSGGVSASPKGGATSSTVSTDSSRGCLDGPEVVVPNGYELVWADEFNVDGKPDSSNWGYESGFVRNEEAQWYQPDNAWVEKGCLVIEGRRERKLNPNYQAGSSDWKTKRQYAEYTSSSLRTMSKRTWQYGRFEMRGRIIAQPGLWPAWWTLGESKEWPSCGEIDIMEYYAGAIRGNVACGTSTRWQAKWDGAAVQVSTLAKNWDTQFHVWRMDWDDQKIDLLLDDKLINTTKLSDMLNPDGSSPFKQPHYMLVNLAIGGQNGGDPSKTEFPSRLELDYIRVYQKL